LVFRLGDQNAIRVILQQHPKSIEIVRVRRLRVRYPPEMEDRRKVGLAG
jgi:hypothetical protein